MKILHIAKIKNHKSTGVNVVVPGHITHQAEFETVYFYNLNEEKINGLEKYQVTLTKGKGFADSLISKLGKPDIVVFHEVNNVENIAIYKSLNKAKIPYIILPHGEIRKQSLQRKYLKKKVAYTLFFNRFILGAKAIQCLTENEAKNIIIKTPKKFIGANGVYLPERTKTTFDWKHIKLIFIGRLDVYHKGIDLMLEAIGSIKDFCVLHRVTLDIYGPDTNGRGDAIKSLIAKYDLSDLVHLKAAIFGEEKEKIILDSDIFILFSRYEGLPTGVLEAMSYGIPCLLTEGTNMEKAWEIGACFYAGETPSDLAAMLKYVVLNKDKCQTVSKMAIDYIKSNYLWDKVSRENVKKYKEILGISSEEL